MIPAALELLMRRLEVHDRKALHGAAMICAELWNAAGMHLDRDKLPEGLAPKDFLPELPEERARREAEEEEQRKAADEVIAKARAGESPEQFTSFKERWGALVKKKF
jgi:hypothetical protein